MFEKKLDKEAMERGIAISEFILSDPDLASEFPLQDLHLALSTVQATLTLCLEALGQCQSDILPQESRWVNVYMSALRGRRLSEKVLSFMRELGDASIASRMEKMQPAIEVIDTIGTDIARLAHSVSWSF